jgi:hypothetical protein
MEAKDFGHRVWDTVAGQRYFRSWMSQTLEALERVACAEEKAKA